MLISGRGFRNACAFFALVVYFTSPSCAIPWESSMALVEKSVLVEHSAAQMHALVEDVARYPEFLPWCGGTEVLSREGDVTCAAIRIDYRGIRQRFSTENRSQPPRLIEMKLVDGPFRQ